MLEAFYTRFVFPHAKALIAFIALLTVFMGFMAATLRVDASAETLLLENDKDLAYTRLVAKRYRTPDFLIITFSPNGDLLGPGALETIERLSGALEELDGVSGVMSILNVPLLQSPPKPVKELLENIPTIGDGTADLAMAREEFLNNPLYASNLVSPDFKTTALQISLDYDQHYFDLLDRLNALRSEQNRSEQALNQAETEFRAYRDAMREHHHRLIAEVREVLAANSGSGELFLGGVDMIADDMITYVKRDLSTFGVAVLLLLVAVLWTVFRQKRWVILPLVIAASSISVTIGLLGLLGFEVTVISSNFIALQLIITISIIIHLIVRYRELEVREQTWPQEKLVLESVLSMSAPTFFAIVTTIAGFASLMLSGIKPVMALGWMMSIGISISLVITYLLFPAINILLKPVRPDLVFDREFSLTKHLARYTEKHGNVILVASGIMVAFAVTGASKLIVENSFIDYFKQSTEIYQGMSVIDRQLGGTTPLSITIDMPSLPKKTPDPSARESGFDEFDEFEAELAAEANEAQYWFTDERMETVRSVQAWLEQVPHVGKVLSLGTLLEVGRTLNEGKELNNFDLALLYNELPETFADMILKPYVSIEHDQVRFALRIIDSDPTLRRNAMLQELERGLVETLGIPAEHVHVSGIMVLYNNMLQSLFDSQIATLGVMVALLFCMFWLIFRSLRVALVAIVANLIPVGVIFGFMGYAAIPLDMMSITIAAISIGIAVDDTIHYLHRFKKELAVDGDYPAAMHRSHASIGYAMSYTSAAIMVGFLILVLSVFIPTITFGLLTVLAMFMAIIADLLLLPKLILLFKPFGNLRR